MDVDFLIQLETIVHLETSLKLVQIVWTHIYAIMFVSEVLKFT